MSKNQFQIRFWGARGTLASTSKDTVKYGGNTACVEITCGEERLIFDAGSGLRMLGSKIATETAKDKSRGSKRIPIHLFFSHCHYDHIAGLPFFTPLYDSNNSVSLWSGHLTGANKTERMVDDYMRSPFFPVGPNVFSAKLQYKDFEPGETLRPTKGVVVKTIGLNHHDECIGFRVNYDGRAICYITDTTHIPDKPNEELIAFIRNADLMVYDSTYTDAEFPQFSDFGHSTWQEGVRLCKAGNVARFSIFHHRPSRTDQAMDQIVSECKKQFRRTWGAREGLVIKV